MSNLYKFLFSIFHYFKIKYLIYFKECKIGKGVKIFGFPNLYGCTLMDNTKIGAYVEIQRNAFIGRRTVISSHSFICSFVEIGNDVFLGHGVMTINDKNPLPNNSNYESKFTIVGHHCSIGSGTTLLPVVLGHHCIIGAGSVVTKIIPPYAVAYGNPAKVVKILTEKEWKERMGVK